MAKFIQNNQSFVCIHCGENVEKHPSSSRDHCNFCLYGLHVDINPGDRLNKCEGKLKPIELEIRNGKERIIYECVDCGEIRVCVVAPDDNREKIIELSGDLII